MVTHFKINFILDSARLTSDFSKVSSLLKPYQHWTSVGTINALSLYSNTNLYDFNPISRGNLFRPTKLIRMVPDTKSFLDRLPGVKFSVRYLVFPPNTGLIPHRDYGISPANGIIRLHVPILTNAACVHVIRNRPLHLRAGALYFFDTTEIHSFYNNSHETRVHLVIDLGVTKETLKLFSKKQIAILSQKGKLNAFPDRFLAPPKIRIGKYQLSSPLKYPPHGRPIHSFRIIRKQNRIFIKFPGVRNLFEISRYDKTSAFCPSLGTGLIFSRDKSGWFVLERGLLSLSKSGKLSFMTRKIPLNRAPRAMT
jgi:hypothetical protein